MNEAKNTKGSIWRKMMRLIIAAFALLYYPIVLAFVSDDKAEIECTKVKVKVNNDSEDVMITEKDLEQIVLRSWPALKGTKVNELNLNDMEKTIELSPVVKKCEMFTTPGGVLHVEVTQREPLMHIFAGGGSYYMDSEANKFIAQRGMKANAIVVNGSVNSAIDDSGLISLCQFIRDDSFWRAQIEQVYVTEKQEFILVPRVGDHIIEFGKTDRMEEKFDNLLALYQKGWKPKEWNLYKKVNLKYKGQVICTKR